MIEFFNKQYLDLSEIILDIQNIKANYHFVDIELSYFIEMKLNATNFIQEGIASNIKKLYVIENYAKNLLLKARAVIYKMLIAFKIEYAHEIIEYQIQHQPALNQVKFPEIDEIQQQFHIEKARAKKNYYSDKHAHYIACKKSNIGALLFHQENLLSKQQKINSGEELKNEIIKNYLLKLKADIEYGAELGSWKARFGFGTVVPGFNRNEPLPDTIALVYNRVRFAIEDGDWQQTFDDMDKYAHIAEKKASSLNFFWRRKPATIDFCRSFSNEFKNVATRLNTVQPATKSTSSCINVGVSKVTPSSSAFSI